MEQQKVGIILGITFIILGLMLQPAKAIDEIEFDKPKIKYFDKSTVAPGDGREDAMCSALYISAVDQMSKNVQAGIDVDKNTAGLEFYSMLQRIMHWKQVQIRMNGAAWASQVEFYTKKMDSPLALQHYNRCWHRVNKLYAEYQIATKLRK